MADSEAVPILVRLTKKPLPDRPADAERPSKKHKSGDSSKKKRHKDRKDGERKHKEGEKTHKEGERKHKEGERKHKEGEKVHKEGEKKELKRPREGEQEGPPKKKKKHSKDKVNGETAKVGGSLEGNGAPPKKESDPNDQRKPKAEKGPLLQPVGSNERSGQDSEQEEAPLTSTAMEDIVSRLQKKDSYQIFAEPVDANAVPDYHDVIKNPMDFATMKKRLAKGLYRSWDDFQAHVELMFDNAQKYNSPDTIFYKTARSMQEASRKMIDAARSNLGAGQRKRQIASRFKDEPASEPKKKGSGWGGRRIKGQKLASIPGVSQLGMMSVEELARLGVKQTVGRSDLRQAWSEANDGEDVPGYRKTKEFWGPKDGRLPLASTEYKRSSYRARELPILGHGPKASAPGGQAHVLVPTGWQPNYAYARSLCRFAAHLPDPVWAKVVAKVQKVLPPGVKFGRGWVGEEEKPSGGKPPEINVLPSTVLKTGAPLNPTVQAALVAKPSPMLTRPIVTAVQAPALNVPAVPPATLKTSLVVVPPPRKEDAEEDQPIGLIYNATPRGASPTPFGRPQSASGSPRSTFENVPPPRSTAEGVPPQRPLAGEAAGPQSTAENAPLQNSMSEGVPQLMSKAAEAAGPISTVENALPQRSTAEGLPQGRPTAGEAAGPISMLENALPQRSMAEGLPQRRPTAEEATGPISMLENAPLQRSTAEGVPGVKVTAGEVAELKSTGETALPQRSTAEGVPQLRPTAGEAVRSKSTVEQEPSGAEIQKQTGDAPKGVTVSQSTTAINQASEAEGASSQLAEATPPDASQPGEEPVMQSDVIMSGATSATDRPAPQFERGLPDVNKEAAGFSNSPQNILEKSLPKAEARSSEVVGLGSVQGQAMEGGSADGKGSEALDKSEARSLPEERRESVLAPKEVPGEGQPVRLAASEALQGSASAPRLDEPSSLLGSAEQQAPAWSEPPTASAQPEEQVLVGHSFPQPLAHASDSMQPGNASQDPSPMSQSADPEISAGPSQVERSAPAKQDAIELPSEAQPAQLLSKKLGDGREPQSADLDGLSVRKKNEGGEQTQEGRPGVTAPEVVGQEELNKQKGMDSQNEVRMDLGGVQELRGGGFEERLPEEKKIAIEGAALDLSEGPLIQGTSDALAERPTEASLASPEVPSIVSSSQQDALSLRAINPKPLILPPNQLISAEEAPSTPTFPIFAAAPPPGSPSLALKARSPSTSLSHGSERAVSVEPLAGFGSPLSVQSFSPRLVPSRASSLAPTGGLPRERASSIDTHDTDPRP